MKLPFSRLRVMPYESFNGAFNMALDYFLARNIAETDDPILRFYGWSPWTLSLGKHQDPTEIDFSALKETGFYCVRRPTGGSAILHADELTYSLIIPGKAVKHHEIYSFLHRRLAAALNLLGYNVHLNETGGDSNYLNKGTDTFACFNRAAKSEIQFNGRKVVGSAQKLYRASLLQHGSVLIGEAQYAITDLLHLSPAEREKQGRFLREKSIVLDEIKPGPLNPVRIAEKLLDVLQYDFDEIVYRYPDKAELSGAGQEKGAFIVGH